MSSELARWLMAALLFSGGLFYIGFNYATLYLNRRRTKQMSVAGLVGGILCALAILVCPIKSLYPWFWMPLILDPGCLPLVGAAIYIENFAGGSKPKCRMSNANYLQIFDALPDLLHLARERDSIERYQIQSELREQYRAMGIAFLWSMPLRSFGKCRHCDDKFTQIIYELENPQRGTLIKTNASHLHAVREHNAELDGKIKLFLEQINQLSPQ